MSRISVEILLSHSADKLRRATLQGVTIFGYRKILCFRGLCHDFCRNFLSDNAEKFCRGTLLCCVSEKFRQRKSLWIRVRGKCPDSPAKISCPTVPKNFVGQPSVLHFFRLPKKFG